ncbi:MAG TPA: nucleotidyltransferase family protein [Chitinophagaceae bacterium]|nr:MAG: nucleotidyltransferase [Bacteroidetes bacterium OLB11]HMN32492.1 nucleotidyltransferase family protein [Chitinophagaceae bacterium]
MHKDCIILAGGLGTRLQSVVADRPKCMALINGKPFLYYICQHLMRFHFCKIIFSVGYMKEMIIDYITSNRKEFKFAFDFAEESEPLGTGGAIVNALPYSDTEDFFVINGDTFFDVNFDELLQYQQTQMADCTLALKPMKVADRYGLVKLNEQSQIIGFEEKKEASSGLINGGVYCIYRNSFMNIPLEKKFSFEKDYLEKHINERDLFGFVQNKYFIDIGIPDDYNKAKQELPQLFDN